MERDNFWRNVVWVSLISLTVIIAGCADPLPDEPLVSAKPAVDARIPIEDVLKIVAAENDVARTLYTAEIVGAGLQAGIPFDEDWQDPDVHAGPLPALFLRGASSSIAKGPIPLGLFLGSDFPISQANAFSENQLHKFEQIKLDGEPQLFYDDEVALNTAMFEDVAVAQPCVVCHNEHPESPKTDWEMDDIMGATTWTYPRNEVTTEEMFSIVQAYRDGVRAAYAAFVVETEGWEDRPDIGEQWPAEGEYAIPTTQVFMGRYEELASAKTLTFILKTAE